ncbi:MAG TPA: helix-turn-helix domain-containing protein [Kofleriaceae bacterium]|nr:helix-turn-helix domain-containing protein [Kofleriaceae bacterium]
MPDAYREYAPPRDLASHVACTWTRRVTRAGSALVIPDACADVIVVGEVAHVAGPADRPERVAMAAGTVIHGLRMRPGAARDLLRTDLGELRNEHVELACVTRALVVDPRQPRTSLEQWARAQLAKARSDGAAVHAARLFIGDASVDAAAEALGFGARRLHRHITAACGYGPKTLHRILRMQRAIRLAYTQSLAAAAAGAGYADQAHMTRELRALTGLPPSAYLAEAEPGVGRWLVSEMFKTPGALRGTLAA